VQVAWGAIKKVFETVFGVIAGVFRTAVGVISRVWAGLTTAAQHVRDAVVAAFRWLVDKLLAAVEWIIRGAAKAFGWIPGIGPKLKKAAKDFEKFRDDVNRALGGIKDRKVTVTAEFEGSPYASQATKEELHKQHGGPVKPGVPYWVGEKGPELVKFRQPGVVLSHRQSMRLMRQLPRRLPAGHDRGAAPAPTPVQVKSGDTNNYHVVAHYPKPEPLTERLPKVMRREQWLRGRD
jgi:hypothetical protein